MGRNDGRLTALDTSNGGNMLQGTARGDSLWLFGLDGKVEPAVTSGTAMQFTQGAAGQPNIDNGKTAYDRACSSCHRSQARAGTMAPPACARPAVAALIMQTVIEGRREMPSFSSPLTAEQTRDVAGYVSERPAR